MLEVQSKKRLAASTQKAIYSDAVKADSVEVLDDISKLDTSWLKLAAPVYHISPNLNDYVITTTILTISDLPNRNGIAFPLEELTRFQEPPLNHLAYKGWSGCPLFVEHCFTADTMISTPAGVKQICDIKVGDEVYTHRKRVRKVTKLYKTPDQETYCVDALGLLYPICATKNHPFYVVDDRQFRSNPEITAKVLEAKTAKHIDQSRNIAAAYGLTKREFNSTVLGPHNRTWLLDNPNVRAHAELRPLKDIYPGNYLVSPILIGGNISVEPEFAFLIGLYAAEGSLGFKQINKKISKDHPKTVCLTLCFNEKRLMDKAVACCEKLDYSYKKSYYMKNNTAILSIENAEFAKACYTLIGKYSSEKQLKGEIRQWDKESILQFLAGYISGDGCLKGRLRCITMSINLAIDIQHCLGFLGIPAAAGGNAHWPSMYTDKQYSKHYRLHEFSNIKSNGEKRKNKGGKPSRFLELGYEVSASHHALPKELKQAIVKNYDVINRERKYKEVGPRILVRNGYLLFPIAHIYKNPFTEDVYNFEVEEDHTYIANTVAVHNCNQDNTKASGVVFDVRLRPIIGYNNNKLYKVIGVVGIDKTKNPELARRVASGEVNTYSMGALADYFTCSYCGTVIDDKHTCKHIHGSADNVNFNRIVDYEGKVHVAFLNAHNLSPFELSVVEDPAWTAALSDTILQS